MTTIPTPAPTKPPAAYSTIVARIALEGYGPGAWHGADMKAAIADVTPGAAFWRPAPARHNIAEIALHHAWSARAVVSRLGAGKDPEPFVLDGEDWFALPDGRTLSWPTISALVEEQQRELTSTIAGIGEGRITSPLADAEQLDLVLGITCHAVYHAGQIQLLKVLGAS